MRSNPMTVAMITPAAYIAVEKAMRKFHEDAPGRFHAQRPSLRYCPFGDKQVGEREPTDAELRARLRSRDEDPSAMVPIIEPCPHLKTM